MCRGNPRFPAAELQVRQSCTGFVVTMRRPMFNEEIVRRIEDALDERKDDRRRDRAEHEPSPERRHRGRRQPSDPATPGEGATASTRPAR